MAFGIVLITGIAMPNPGFAQSKEDAQVIVRIQQLEDQVRTLTGQVEGLQFQLTQMQELIQKQNDDNEFRFQQLEGGGGKGGAGKKTEAATQPGGETPSGALPQAPEGAQTTTPPTDTSALPPPVNTDQGAAAPQSGDQDMDGDNLGESADPLVGSNGADGQTAPLSLPDDGASRPLNLSLDSSQDLSNGDAEAQYKAGYDAIVRGDYAFAEDQFRQFIALYPKDPQVADATNWLGEALLQRQAYDEAADVLLNGWQANQQSPRAPDLLLKLGVALAGAGEQDTACRTFGEVAKRYPKQPAAFNSKLAQEKQKAQCPA